MRDDCRDMEESIYILDLLRYLVSVRLTIFWPKHELSLLQKRSSLLYLHSLELKVEVRERS